MSKISKSSSTLKHSPTSAFTKYKLYNYVPIKEGQSEVGKTNQKFHIYNDRRPRTSFTKAQTDRLENVISLVMLID